jgi:hypothetical protein
MTPQDSFMIVAPLRAGEQAPLRALLASMNLQPGMADPQNPILPFGAFPCLHVARFLILEDLTPRDVTTYGLPPSNWQPALCFLGDCDGPADQLLADLAQRARAGLGRIFAFCADFQSESDLFTWMKQRSCRPAAVYVNWIGRTVRQIREEAALRDALISYLRAHPQEPPLPSPARLREELTRFVAAERAAGRLTLTPAEPTPPSWQLRNLAHLIGVPLALLLFAPLLIIYLPLFLWQLRARETTDPEITLRPEPAHLRALGEIEDYDVSNQFSAFGTLKPGLFRCCTVSFLLWLLDYSARHIYHRGHLTRVGTIHFARWVFLDGKKRLLFASNYDSSLESYMDDFINKVAWGLNLVFSNGIGYPTTNWLINDGAKDEQKVKYYSRRRELPTEVWYKAYPGLTTFDLVRNMRIRAGLERTAVSDAEVLEWLSLL